MFTLKVFERNGRYYCRLLQTDKLYDCFGLYIKQDESLKNTYYIHDQPFALLDPLDLNREKEQYCTMSINIMPRREQYSHKYSSDSETMIRCLDKKNKLLNNFLQQTYTYNFVRRKPLSIHSNYALRIKHTRRGYTNKQANMMIKRYSFTLHHEYSHSHDLHINFYYNHIVTFKNK